MSFLFSDWRRGTHSRGAPTSELTRRADTSRLLNRHLRSLEKLDAKVREARAAVQKQDELMRQLVRQTKYLCTGFAFATFNTELAAKRYPMKRLPARNRLACRLSPLEASLALSDPANTPRPVQASPT